MYNLKLSQWLNLIKSLAKVKNGGAVPSLPQNKTNIDHTLNKFNKLQPNINFTIEKELHESIHSFILFCSQDLHLAMPPQDIEHVYFN
jgi:hypothetical protein